MSGLVAGGVEMVGGWGRGGVGGGEIGTTECDLKTLGGGVVCVGGGGGGGVNNNNSLFMVLHLLRAQSAYKDISHKDTLISSHTHTHIHAGAHTPSHTHTRTTNTCLTGDGLVKRQISMQRRRDGFSVPT